MQIYSMKDIERMKQEVKESTTLNILGYISVVFLIMLCVMITGLQ